MCSEHTFNVDNCLLGLN